MCCVQVHRVHCMHTAHHYHRSRSYHTSTSGNMCIKKKEKKGEKARWMRSAATRPSGETCKHSGIETRLIASRFRPLGHGFVRLRVFDVFTLFFSGVAPLFLWRNDLCLLHSLCSILGSSHPLPTTKRRLTPQRPETLRKTSCAGWDVRFSVPYSDNSRGFR